MNAVIKAITPGLYLRKVLETTDDLALEMLMKFLQSYFLERNTLDLSQHLTPLTQGQQESVTQFIYEFITSNEFKTIVFRSIALE